MHAEDPKPLPYRIRRASRGDEPALSSLVAQLFAQHALLLPQMFEAPGAAQIAVQCPGATDSSRAMLVADSDGVVLGMVSARVYDTPAVPGLVAARRGYLDDLVVAPSARRKGVGRALMAAVECWLREAGATQVTLTLWAGNALASELYLDLGYAELGSVLGKKL